MATRKISAPVFSFATKREVADRLSGATTIKAIHFDQEARSIKAFCADGFTRECKVDRLSNIEAGRALWVMLSEATKNETSIQFVVAGGFSADKWFYNAKPVTAAPKGMPF